MTSRRLASILALVVFGLTASSGAANAAPLNIAKLRTATVIRVYTCYASGHIYPGGVDYPINVRCQAPLFSTIGADCSCPFSLAYPHYSGTVSGHVGT